jgi:uncharacterized protein (TIGR02246 family)
VNPSTEERQGVTTSDEPAIAELYERVMACWNRRDAIEYAATFAEDGNIVGFDGSQVDGRTAIESHLRAIFTDHTPATYVWKIREIRLLSPEVAILRAVVGMIPPGKSDFNPAANAVQSLVAVKRDGVWDIALFHNTPAQFHGRPEAVESLTKELRQLL